MLTLVVALMLVNAASSTSPFFFKYPERIGFAIAGNQAMYPYFELSEPEQRDIEFVFNRSAHADSVLGLVVNENTNNTQYLLLEYDLVHVPTTMVKMPEPYVFYEKINKEYIERVFEYAEERLGPVDPKHRLYVLEEGDDARALCDAIPRCLGYNDEFLLSNSYDTTNETTAETTLFTIKRTEHDAVIWVRDNLTITLAIVLGAALLQLSFM